jgi:hypothetical protein
VPKPWKHLIEPDQIDVVAPDGTVRCRVEGYYGGNIFTIDDLTVDKQETRFVGCFRPEKRKHFRLSILSSIKTKEASFLAPITK